MSRVGWSKAASLQVVVAPLRQKHQKILGCGPRHQSKAMWFPDSKATEWDRRAGSCLIWVQLFICLSGWWNRRPQRELSTQAETECDLCSCQASLGAGGPSITTSTFGNLVSGDWKINWKSEDAVETSLVLWSPSIGPFTS